MWFLMAGMVPALYLRHLKMEREMRTMMLVLALAVLAACGGNGTSSPSSGDGGNGSTSSTSSSGTSANGGGGSSSSGSGGGGSTGVCGPTPEDPLASKCQAGDVCVCPVEKLGPTDPEWCAAWEAEGVYICTEGSNTCGFDDQGVPRNACGVDLPKGEYYQLPNGCKDFVRNDTWVPYGYPDKAFDMATSWLAYGQLQLPIGCDLGAYCDGTIMSGNDLYWNRYNKDTLPSTEGEFSPDCKTITLRYYDAGEPSPYGEGVYVWSFHNNG